LKKEFFKRGVGGLGQMKPKGYLKPTNCPILALSVILEFYLK